MKKDVKKNEGQCDYEVLRFTVEDGEQTAIVWCKRHGEVKKVKIESED
jgi:hypothetical protein